MKQAHLSLECKPHDVKEPFRDRRWLASNDDVWYHHCVKLKCTQCLDQQQILMAKGLGTIGAYIDLLTICIYKAKLENIFLVHINTVVVIIPSGANLSSFQVQHGQSTHFIRPVQHGLHCAWSMLSLKPGTAFDIEHKQLVL